MDPPPSPASATTPSVTAPARRSTERRPASSTTARTRSRSWPAPPPSANLLTGLATDETFTRTDSTGTSTLLPDALGSTTALTDSSGTIQTQYTYDPFGNATPSGAANANSYQFTGRENDGTGLDYYRARYYSPTLQRFISEDPLGFGGGDPNLYAYAGNDPIDLTDPSGECPICAAVVAGALIGAGVGGVSAWLSGGNVLRGAGEGALAGGVGVLAGAAVLAVAGPVGVGATAAAIASAFTAGAVGDTAVQGADIVLGARKSFDPGEAVLSGAIGAVTGGWYESGWEIKINSNLRIAPFGNRTDNPTGELPHYHRRGLDPSNPGATSPGQGIGRHRPWDTRTPDTSFWNRF